MREVHINNLILCLHLLIAHIFLILQSNNSLRWIMKEVIYHQLQCHNIQIFLTITLIILLIIQIWYTVQAYNLSSKINLNWTLQFKFTIILVIMHNQFPGLNHWVINMKMAVDSMINIIIKLYQLEFLIIENKTVLDQ